MSDEAFRDYIITGGADNSVKVQELQDKRLVLKHSLEGHSCGVNSVAVSNNGKLCASSSFDQTMRIWDLEKGKRIAYVHVRPEDLQALAFSPDDTSISGSGTGKITVHNVETAKAEQTVDNIDKLILSITCSPDGKYIATGTDEGIVNIYNAANNKLWHFLEDHTKSVRSICFSSNFQYLLTASDDSHIKLYDLKDETFKTFSNNSSSVTSVAFSPNGKYFVSRGVDETVRVWKLSSKRCVFNFKEHKFRVWDVKFSPDSRKIVSVSEDKSINVYTCPM